MVVEVEYADICDIVSLKCLPCHFLAIPKNFIVNKICFLKHSSSVQYRRLVFASYQLQVNE